MSVETGYAEITKRIAVVTGRWRARRALSGLVVVAAWGVAAAAVLVVLDAYVGLPAVLRLAFVAAVAIAVAVGLAALVIRPLARRLSSQDVAAHIEARYPELGERLRSAAGLWGKRGTGRHGYSVELIDALIDEAAGLIEGRDLSDAAAVSGLARRAVAFFVVAAVAVAGVAVTGDRGRAALERLARPWERMDAPLVTLTVAPGDTTLVAGETLTVLASLSGPAAEPAPRPSVRSAKAAVCEVPSVISANRIFEAE